MKSLEAETASPVSAPPGGIYEIDPLHDDRWIAFTARCSKASLYHRREWLQALKNAYGCEPFAITSSAPGKDLENAIVSCRVRSWLTGNRLVALPFSDHCEPLANDPADVDELLAHLSSMRDQSRWKYAEIRPVSYVPPPNLRFGTHITYCLHRLDLCRSEEALFKSFHKNCIQRKITRAERESLRYDEGTSETLLLQFYKLMIETRRRLGIPPQPLKWFRSLIGAFGPDLKIRVASKEGTPVASILTIRTNRAMVYKYGCSDERFNNLGGMIFLLWSAIREARAAGLEELDLGRSDIHQEGLIAFKEHWGAQRSTLNYWCYPAPPHKSGDGRGMSLFKKVASRAPRASLVLLGNLLYRHIA
jgi:Acetyltransferase (GNAT) domain